MMTPDVALTIESLTKDEEHAFKIDAPLAVQGILRDIARHGERVALYFGERQDNVIVTVVLEVNTAGFVMDATRDDGLNQQITNSQSPVFVSAHLQAKVQFPLPRLALVTREGIPAFYADFPGYLTRLQRRDYFRLYLPPGLLNCHVPRPNGESEGHWRLTVRDISEGGVALYDEKQQAELKPGDEIHDCRLLLEDGLELVFGLQVRHSLLSQTDGEAQLYLGCRFITLSTRMASQLQRFITRRQREKLP